jgi:hypothetical protein
MGRAAQGGMSEHERRGRAERGDLRQCEIDEDYFAGEHLDAEIGVDAGEADSHQERRHQKRKCLGHFAAAFSAATFASNSAM